MAISNEKLIEEVCNLLDQHAAPLLYSEIGIIEILKYQKKYIPNYLWETYIEKIEKMIINDIERL